MASMSTNDYNYLTNSSVYPHMQVLIEHFISSKPYEKVLWELYAPNTLEQFKTNLKIQDFVSSKNFEYMLERANSQDINERKVLFGMLYYNNDYYKCCSIDDYQDERLKMIIDMIGDLSNDNIKYLIQVVSIAPLIGDIEEIEEDIKFICENNQQTEFLDYLHEMLNLSNIYIRPVDIIHSFDYNIDELELFKDYCKSGIWSKHAKEFIEENLIMTDQRKEIYFALVGRVNHLNLHVCVEDNIMRDLTINPLTPEEQEYLNYELHFNRSECGLPHN